MLGRSSLPVYFPSDSFWNWLMQMVERITFLLALLFIDFCSGLCLYSQGLYPHILKSLSFVMCPVAFCIACHSFSRYPLFTSSQIAPSWFSFDLTGCPYLVFWQTPLFLCVLWLKRMMYLHRSSPMAQHNTIFPCIWSTKWDTMAFIKYFTSLSS